MSASVCVFVCVFPFLVAFCPIYYFSNTLLIFRCWNDVLFSIIFFPVLLWAVSVVHTLISVLVFVFVSVWCGVLVLSSLVFRFFWLRSFPFRMFHVEWIVLRSFYRLEKCIVNVKNQLHVHFNYIYILVRSHLYVCIYTIDTCGKRKKRKESERKIKYNVCKRELS